jgi:hypothetical protein
MLNETDMIFCTWDIRICVGQESEKKERNNWEYQDISGWIILKLNFRRICWYGLDLSGCK